MKDNWVKGYTESPDNSNKNFVRRIKEGTPGTAISRPVEDARESLRMANSGNKVFPTIEVRDGKLATLSNGRKPQETIETTTSEQAEILAWNEYKRNNPQFKQKIKSE